MTKLGYPAVKWFFVGLLGAPLISLLGDHLWGLAGMTAFVALALFLWGIDDMRRMKRRGVKP